MLTKKFALLMVILGALILPGCGTGETESGPTAAGSGAPGPSSGAAGAHVESPQTNRDR